jgi:hypothetical protein
MASLAVASGATIPTRIYLSRQLSVRTTTENPLRRHSLYVITAREGNNMNEVSRELCTKVGEELENFAVGYFKTAGLVKGKVAFKYGHNFSFKIEGYAYSMRPNEIHSDEVSKDLAKRVGDGIIDYAKVMFEENGLTFHKSACKYGSHFTLTITAEPLVLGRNGVNVGSECARTFDMVAHKYGMTKEDLGAEGVINNKRFVLLGADYKRNGDIHLVVRRWDNGQTYILKSDSMITYFGGKYEKVGA